MGDARKIWQFFKSKVPNFDKSKKFKSDAGPQMDSVENLIVKLIDSAEKDWKDAKDLETQVKSLLAAMKGYSVIADDLEKEKDADFLKYKKDFDGAQKALCNLSIVMNNKNEGVGKVTKNIVAMLR